MRTGYLIEGAFAVVCALGLVIAIVCQVVSVIRYRRRLRQATDAWMRRGVHSAVRRGYLPDDIQ